MTMVVYYYDWMGLKGSSSDVGRERKEVVKRKEEISAREDADEWMSGEEIKLVKEINRGNNMCMYVCRYVNI
jgi:hypothetical protein